MKKVTKLIELGVESGSSELGGRDGVASIRIARHGAQVLAVPSAPPAVQAQPSAAPVSRPAGSGAGPADAGHQVRSPMAGTFYTAPSPEAEPFVTVGQAVEPGDVLCIIESMKMMNEIKAERAGVCAAILVENGEAIGSGQALFRFA